MDLQTLVYNLLLLPVTFWAVHRVRKRRTLGAAVAGLATVCTVALLLAGPVGLSVFGAMRLFSYGLFGHGALAAFGSSMYLAPRAGLLARSAGVSLVAVAVFAFVIEPYRLEVTEYRYETSRVSRPLRILLMADLQTDQIGAYERRVFETAMALAPDLILMSGDYLHAEDYRQRIAVRSELRRLLQDVEFAAPLGVIAVQGNVDTRDWRKSFEGLPVQTVEKARTIRVSNGVDVTALGLWQSFETELVVPRPREALHVVIGHAPDYALGDVDADLLLAGHTHGGQVRLPFIGPLITFSRVPRSWAAGATSLPGSRALVVSRGIGMERKDAPRLRFLCRPELAVIDVVPKATPTTAP